MVYLLVVKVKRKKEGKKFKVNQSLLCENSALSAA